MVAELSTSMTALVPLFQAAIVPSSVAKRNTAALPLTWKALVPLKMRPVGAEGPVAPMGAGIVTTNALPTGSGVPSPLQTVDTPMPLSPTQNGPEGLASPSPAVAQFA